MTKRLVPLFVAIAVCGFVCGCAKVASEPEKESAAVIFDVGFTFDGGTKASGAETNVNRLQIGLYNAAGELEWENTYEYAFTTVKTVSGLEAGPKTIVAVANKVITMPATLEEFYAIPVSLGENRRDSFVMSGIESAEASTDPQLTTIHLMRLVTKVTVRGALSVRWGDGKAHDFEIERIYLANVVTKTNMKGESLGEFVNPREDTEQTKDEILRDFTVSDKDYWVNGGAYNKGVDFYVFPNVSQERRTALIIRARYDGQLCYYPLVVSDELVRNTVYRCGSIVITCIGMPNPDDDFSSTRVNFDYMNVDWLTGETEGNIEFK